MKPVKHIFIGTLLSILTFFSVSFLTFLAQISPLRYYTDGNAYQLKIGFPFVYYQQFWLRGNDYPNFGWNGSYLFYDCLLTWMAVTGLYILLKKLKR